MAVFKWDALPLALHLRTMLLLPVLAYRSIKGIFTTDQISSNWCIQTNFNSILKQATEKDKTIIGIFFLKHKWNNNAPFGRNIWTKIKPLGQIIGEFHSHTTFNMIYKIALYKIIIPYKWTYRTFKTGHATQWYSICLEFTKPCVQSPALQENKHQTNKKPCQLWCLNSTHWPLKYRFINLNFPKWSRKRCSH